MIKKKTITHAPVSPLIITLAAFYLFVSYVLVDDFK